MPTRTISLGNTITPAHAGGGGSVAGTFALATDTASAPALPPGRRRRTSKGRASGLISIRRSSTTPTISRSTPTNRNDFRSGNAANNEKALSVIGKPERIA